MKSLLIVALLTTMMGAGSPAQVPSTPSPHGWTLIWSDEFNGPTIDTLHNWTFDIGAGGWGNAELEYYTGRPENARAENGMLEIIARNESFGGASYTSARLKSQGRQSFTYGRIEARIKLPAGQGIWPAFWMLGRSISHLGWPKCGEIDIVEHINTSPDVNGTMHWDNNGHVQYGATVPCDVSRFHVYAVEWDSSRLTWYADSVKYLEASIARDTNSTEEFHLPFFIILNLAIGGNWPGNPTAATPFPDTMFVDYVRVYQPSTRGVQEGETGVPRDNRLLQDRPHPLGTTPGIAGQELVLSGPPRLMRPTAK